MNMDEVDRLRAGNERLRTLLEGQGQKRGNGVQDVTLSTGGNNPAKKPNTKARKAKRAVDA